jgi:hypothetical protein
MQSILPMLAMLVHFTFQNAKNELSIQYLSELTITLAIEQVRNVSLASPHADVECTKNRQIGWRCPELRHFLQDFTIQAYQKQVLKSKPLPFILWFGLVLVMTGGGTIGEGRAAPFRIFSRL